VDQEARKSLRRQGLNKWKWSVERAIKGRILKTYTIATASSIQGSKIKEADKRQTQVAFNSNMELIHNPLPNPRQDTI
jgi:hypothetical protein